MEKQPFAPNKEAVLSLNDTQLREAVQNLAALSGLDTKKAEAVSRDIGGLRRKLASISEADMESLLEKLPVETLSKIKEQLKMQKE